MKISEIYDKKARGTLLGLACGDAVGTTVEFCPRDRFTPVTNMIGGGKFRLAPGEWTDDTSMALCLADSLLACEGFDAKDQMEQIVVEQELSYLLEITLRLEDELNSIALE